MLLAGQIGKPHGLGGDVYVVRISDDPSRFEPGAELTHQNGQRLVVATARVHRDRFLVRFVGYEDRTSAESLRGALYVEEDARRELDEGEFWADDIIGARVENQQGEFVGMVTDVVEGAAQDLLIVDTEAGERMIPLVKEIVLEVSAGDGRVVVDPPEGLLD